MPVHAEAINQVMISKNRAGAPGPLLVTDSLQGEVSVFLAVGKKSYIKVDLRGSSLRQWQQDDMYQSGQATIPYKANESPHLASYFHIRSPVTDRVYTGSSQECEAAQLAIGCATDPPLLSAPGHRPDTHREWTHYTEEPRFQDRRAFEAVRSWYLLPCGYCLY
ncbi:unnamed protein product [Pleuronectes platessa]|uniref:Uncharacterized protein n=1 Tax=Pleuronectes platessa TaxID=8262 RepID=A0A9N7VSS0_PLEPL|nr:unnamed protein product [Pleuronectes platessa]